MPRTAAYRTKYARTDLSAIIRDRMYKQNVTQADLAKKLGISRPTANLIINGKAPLSFERFIEISDYLKFTSSDLRQIIKAGA